LPVIVLKLGGSLMRSKELVVWLENIFSRTRDNIIIVVPGGGEFAENIREAQRQLNFNNKIAHKMALLAMCQYGYFLTGINADIKILKNTEILSLDKNIGGSFLWLPDDLLENISEITGNWDFSSDSISLWLATYLTADKLVIVKSKKIIYNQSRIKKHIVNEDVDKGFKKNINKYKGEIFFLEKTEHCQLENILSE
tara:strand:- start:96 stop:686 length:591 start_codon:yes stop_codon:yes gene_type:complete